MLEKWTDRRDYVILMQRRGKGRNIKEDERCRRDEICEK